MRSLMIMTLFAVATALGSITANAAVPTSMTVQGKLTDASGVPLPAGAKTFTFRIFDAATLGTQIWPAVGGEIQSITSSTDGLWVGLVGAVSPLTEVVFADSARWLEIDVNGTTLPRVRLVTGPYTFRVATVDGASGGTITSKLSIGTGHINSGNDAFVAGASNQVTGNQSVVSGGQNNVASGLASTISGGRDNKATGGEATIGGGEDNVASVQHSTIAGGGADTASGLYSTIGGGQQNSASGDFATIGGGQQNSASGDFATIGGGGANRATASNATIGGGHGNTASDQGAAVAGGVNNSAFGRNSVIAGGAGNISRGINSFVGGGGISGAGSDSNLARGNYSIVGGGSRNRAFGEGAVVVGGIGNSAVGIRSFVGGGGAALSGAAFDSNTAIGVAAAVVAGKQNAAVGDQSFVGCGLNNSAEGTQSAAVGGTNNTASGKLSVVSGGAGNTASGDWSTVPGGISNESAGRFSLAAGRQAKANHSGAFVWADSSNADFPSTAANQFLIRAGGGVGIGTNTPEAPLHVMDGNVAGISGNSSASAVFERNSDNWIHMLTPSANQCGIVFGLSGNSLMGSIRFNPPGNEKGYHFRCGNNDTRLVLDSLGNLTADGCVVGSNVACPSDARFKRNIETLPNALGVVEKLRGVRYEWKTDEFPDRDFSKGEQIGLVAQEVRELVPQAVIEQADGYLAVDYARLVPLLIEAVKEQQKHIDALEKKLDQQAP